LRRAITSSAAVGAVGAAAASSAQAAAQRCEVTGGDILGPFYRPDAAMAAQSQIALAAPGQAGTPVTLTGRILRPDCLTPVAHAVVDVWQADHEGHYDIKTPDEAITPDHYKMRGQARTNARGEFTLVTVVPGKYKIPPGLENFEKFEGYLRPAHIHLTVTHPVYLPLTTQLYFSGDPQIAKDPWARHSKNMIRLAQGQGRFDIVLGNTPPHKA